MKGLLIKLNMKDKLKDINIQKIIEAASFFAVLACVYCSIKMNIVGRALWLDEAMLAMSVIKRNIFELCASPLEWNQSAPVGYLLVIKLFEMFFGHSEAALRIFSILSYIVLLIVFYYFVSKTIQMDFPMLATAGLANIAYLLEYSNMFKPYICDTLSVFLVLIFYYLYREKKIRFLWLCVVYFILIWFSNPVAFMSGGVVAYEILNAILKKDSNKLKEGIVLGITIVVSFIIMYLVWLKPTLEATNLSDFWQGYQFPILIVNREILHNALEAIKFVTVGIGPAWKIILVLAALAVVINIFKIHNPYVWVLTFAAGLVLIASNRGFFPMSDRLFLFSIPLLFYLAIFTVTEVAKEVIKEKYVPAFIGILLLAFFLTGTGIEKYHTGEAYRPGEESTEALEFLKENVKADDLVYVYYPGVPVFQYKIGYNKTGMNGGKNNIIYGEKFFYDNQNPEDIELISNQDGIYIFFSHVVEYEPLDELMNTLKEKGELTSICGEYLYYYSKK